MTPAVESAIIAKLAALEATGAKLFRRVASISEASTQVTSAQITPAAYVGFDGFKVNDVNSDSTNSKIEESWAVIIVVKSAKQGDGGKDGRDDGIALARAAYKALSGSFPIEGGRPLVPVTPKERPAWDGGFYWLPLSFTRQSVINAKE
jgi:hypothetical protein